MFVVFTEIQRLCLGGDSLAGIVLEFSAGAIQSYDTLLDAKNSILIQFGAVDTIGAGTLDFLAKQHDHDLF